jgi:hypothetical protein
MHEYEAKSFTPEQEAQLRASSGPSAYYENFLTEKEFDICRHIAMSKIDWPEHGQVAKYWGFGWDHPLGRLLTFLKPKIDAIIPNWELDFLAMQEAIVPWRLHADIRWYPNKLPYKVILMPMDVEPMSGPVEPDAWPETHSIAFHQRSFLKHNELKGEAKTGNADQSGWTRPIDDPQFEGIVPGQHVSEADWQKYFSHMPYNHLEGVTVEARHLWRPRSLIYWDNNALHCADNFLGDGIRTKRSLMLFTNIKQN